MPVILKVYANYIINVLNDRDQGRMYLKEMRDRREQEKEQQKNLNNDLLGQPTPCCLIQFTEEERGVIA